jgi:hypothetical protein
VLQWICRWAVHLSCHPAACTQAMTEMRLGCSSVTAQLQLSCKTVATQLQTSSQLMKHDADGRIEAIFSRCACLQSAEPIHVIENCTL